MYFYRHMRGGVWFDVSFSYSYLLCVCVCGSLSSPAPIGGECCQGSEGSDKYDFAVSDPWLNAIPPKHDASIEYVVELFFQGQGHFQPSWRAVIFALDGAMETHIANRIRHYAESI
jgi:hypothetical protein